MPENKTQNKNQQKNTTLHNEMTSKKTASGKERVFSIHRIGVGVWYKYTLLY